MLNSYDLCAHLESMLRLSIDEINHRLYYSIIQLVSFEWILRTDEKPSEGICVCVGMCFFVGNHQSLTFKANMNGKVIVTQHFYNFFPFSIYFLYINMLRIMFNQNNMINTYTYVTFL